MEEATTTTDVKTTTSEETVATDSQATADADIAVLPVVGLSKSAAEDLLEVANFSVSVQDIERPPGSADVGVVVSQAPNANTKVPPNSVVTIGIGRSTGLAGTNWDIREVWAGGTVSDFEPYEAVFSFSSEFLDLYHVESGCLIFFAQVNEVGNELAFSEVLKDPEDCVLSNGLDHLEILLNALPFVSAVSARRDGGLELRYGDGNTIIVDPP